jgi:hypothetical protein
MSSLAVTTADSQHVSSSAPGSWVLSPSCQSKELKLSDWSESRGICPRRRRNWMIALPLT